MKSQLGIAVQIRFELWGRNSYRNCFLCFLANFPPAQNKWFPSQLLLVWIPCKNNSCEKEEGSKHRNGKNADSRRTKGTAWRSVVAFGSFRNFCVSFIVWGTRNLVLVCVFVIEITGNLVVTIVSTEHVKDSEYVKSSIRVQIILSRRIFLQIWHRNKVPSPFFFGKDHYFVLVCNG